MVGLGATMGGTLSLAGSQDGILNWTSFGPWPNWITTDVTDRFSSSQDSADGLKFTDIQNLSVDIGLMTVVMIGWDEDEIVIDTSDVSRELLGQLNIGASGDTLNISMRNVRNWSGLIGNQSSTLRIFMPKDQVFDRADLFIGAGEIIVEQIEATVLDISIGAGAGEIKEFSAETVSIHVGAGRLEMSGAVEEQLEADCGMGEVVLHLDGTEADFGYAIDVGMGSVQVGSLNVSGMGRQATGNLQTAEAMLNIRAGMGRVEVNFIDR